jgi:hypothetical protein
VEVWLAQMSDIDADKDKPNRGKISKRISCAHNGSIDNSRICNQRKRLSRTKLYYKS